MIEIKDFSKSYGDNKVYENFNLRVEDDKITCILGESGCGKTTLLNAIAGVIPFDGEITSGKYSYVFQEPRLVPNLTVEDNLKLVSKDEEKIRDMLQKLHIEDKAKSYPKNLSGGQAQRVSLARAFLFESDCILMDEPFSSLNLKLKREIIDLFIKILKEDKRCALFVTHDIDEALTLAERIVVLKDGVVVYDKNLEGGVPRDYNEEQRRELISVLVNI